MFTFRRSTRPSCIECADKRNCHICLLCGQVGCGRQHLGHCLNHFRNEGHSFALEVRRMASECHERACIRKCALFIHDLAFKMRDVGEHGARVGLQS